MGARTGTRSERKRETSFALSDLGNAERLIHQYGEGLRYCKGTGGWLIWTGQLWRIADSCEVLAFAKDTAKSIANEAPLPGYGAAECLRHAHRSQSRQALESMVALAQSDEKVRLTHERLDAHAWLLGTPEGTIELQTGRVRASRPGDYLTRSISVPLQADAKSPRWERFIAEMTLGDIEFQRYLQRVVGYVLTGSTQEQCFFYLHGTGANGKSTFLNVLSELMGNYARQAESTTFTLQQGDRVRNDLARLAGARLVTAVEPPTSRALDDSLLKQITGGDTMTARHLYREYFEFQPVCKVFLAANVLPKPTGLDNGLWRRLKCIPCRLQLDEADRDPELQDALLNELPGILNWAIEGCLEWQRVGLREPQVLAAAKQEYRSSRDPLGNFLSECCVTQAGAEVPYPLLYGVYVAWCGQSGEHPAPKRVFGQELRDRGYETRTGGQRKNLWLGVALAERGLALALSEGLLPAGDLAEAA